MTEIVTNEPEINLFIRYMRTGTVTQPVAEAFSNKSARVEAPSRARSRAAASANTSLTIACSPARVSGAQVCARSLAAFALIGKTNGVSSLGEGRALSTCRD